MQNPETIELSNNRKKTIGQMEDISFTLYKQRENV